VISNCKPDPYREVPVGPLNSTRWLTRQNVEPPFSLFLSDLVPTALAYGGQDYSDLLSCDIDTTVGKKAEIAIREVSAADAVPAAELSGQLGYPVEADVLKRRLSEILAEHDHSVLGAYAEDCLVGWIDIGIVQHLQSGKYGEIGGLIVSAAHQGRGIGKALMQVAEQWVLDRGVETILVRSQIAREAAHVFYLQRNFSRIKTSSVFQKSLAAKRL
jgi:GNAT superfamily N-acetyltransferase